MRSPPTAPAAGLASILPDHSFGSLALAAAVAASARDDGRSGAPDAVLIALGAQMDRAEAVLVEMRAVVFLDIKEKNAEAWAAYRAADETQEEFIRTRIAPLRAMTPASAAVKARALAYLHHPESFQRAHLEDTTAGAIIASLVDDLAAQVTAAEAHSEAMTALTDEAVDSIAFILIPAAACWRPSDWPAIYSGRSTSLTGYGSGKDAIWVYDGDKLLDGFRGKLAAWKQEAADTSPPNATPHNIARVEEIIAAVELREAQVRAAEEAAGFPACVAAESEAMDAVRALQSRIATLPAVAVEGMAVKVRVALDHWAFTGGGLMAGGLPKIIEACAAGKASWGEAAAASLVLDLLRLAQAAPAAEAA